MVPSGTVPDGWIATLTAKETSALLPYQSLAAMSTTSAPLRNKTWIELLHFRVYRRQTREIMQPATNAGKYNRRQTREIVQPETRAGNRATVDKRGKQCDRRQTQVNT